MYCSLNFVVNIVTCRWLHMQSGTKESLKIAEKCVFPSNSITTDTVIIQIDIMVVRLLLNY